MSRFWLAVGLLMLVPSACRSDGGTAPDPIDPAALLGIWSLTPVPTLTCDFGENGGIATLSFDSIDVISAEGEDLLVNVILNAEHFSLGQQNSIKSFSTTVNVSTGRFTVAGEMILAWTASGVAFDGVVDLDLAVDFDGEVAFDATFAAEMVGAVTLTGGSQQFNGVCTDVAQDVTGTRS
jgi:hypothetical protein